MFVPHMNCIRLSFIEQLPKEFSGSALETIEVNEEVIDLVGNKVDNYYHWMAEGLTRFAIWVTIKFMF